MVFVTVLVVVVLVVTRWRTYTVRIYGWKFTGGASRWLWLTFWRRWQAPLFVHLLPTPLLWQRGWPISLTTPYHIVNILPIFLLPSLLYLLRRRGNRPMVQIIRSRGRLGPIIFHAFIVRLRRWWARWMSSPTIDYPRILAPRCFLLFFGLILGIKLASLVLILMWLQTMPFHLLCLIIALCAIAGANFGTSVLLLSTVLLWGSRLLAKATIHFIYFNLLLLLKYKFFFLLFSLKYNILNK